MLAKKTAVSRTWYFQFSSDAEREEWLIAINNAVIANSKTETALKGFLDRQMHGHGFGMVNDENSVISLAEGFDHQRRQNNVPDQGPGAISVASIMGKMEAKSADREVLTEGQGFNDRLAYIDKLAKIREVATKMSENSSQGVVDFDLQREYLNLVSKNSSLKLTIMAPVWAQQIMLPGRGGLWIESITPCSPASYVPGLELQHDVIVAVNSTPFPGDPAEAIEFNGKTRWGLTERGFDTTYTIYNLKTRQFRLYVLPPNPGNLPKAPMASGVMGKWIKGLPDNGIVPENEEPSFPPL